LARLLRKIFEVDPLLCPQCDVEMQIVSVIEEALVVDRILPLPALSSIPRCAPPTFPLRQSKSAVSIV
jgi:hypothetical protein